MSLPKTEEMLEVAAAYEQDAISLLKELVEIESPTYDREAVNQVGKLIKEHGKQLGARIAVEPSHHEERGDHVIATWAGEDESLKPLLVIAHMDTVWQKGTLETMPFREEGNTISGPGVFDMKGAISFLLTAVKMIQDYNDTLKRPLTVLFNSDEEMNSATSREIIGTLAKESEAVLILEGGEGDAVLTERKGIMYFKLTASGVSSHAGMDHEKGTNAIEEIAHQILRIQQLTDYEKGTTLSCGIIKGGTRTNVIPAEAVLEVDARVPSEEEITRLSEKMASLSPVLSGAALDLETLVKRPPLDRTEKVVALYEKAKKEAKELGYELTEASTGAISDGNLTAAAGVPTLDGLGPIGAGAHAAHEHIVRDKIPKRLALLVQLLRTL
ncbi:M20 family metallopeptidase [Salibacterium aidingense]|uniref:M20 family metallopeptidase n=1 Tax=Salibacterium aidingense TaxID=384933 RepID=UPI003BCDB15F